MHREGCFRPGGIPALVVGGAALLALVSRVPAAAADAAGKVLVICAPGYPGDTRQAQPTVDAFAAAAASAAGWPAGRLGAVYFETEDGGLDRLAKSDAAFALVPYPFFVQHGSKLGLKPVSEVAEDSGSTETWSLVAKRGVVKSAASLEGWEIASSSGYASSFVKGPALEAWGTLPASVRITFSAGVLSPLRRASQGEKVAVLLDGTQAGSLSKLPFAGQLEVVARSKPLPKSLLCAVGDRASPSEIQTLTKALLHLHEKPEGKEVLKTMHITRFEPARSAALRTASH